MEMVIDTSIVIAVITNEPTKSALIERTMAQKLFAPSSLHWEIGNAFSAMLKRKRITLKQCMEALTLYKEIPISYIDVDIQDALRLADTLNIYAYDAYILACAQARGSSILSLNSGLIYAAKQIGIEVQEV